MKINRNAHQAPTKNPQKSSEETYDGTKELVASIYFIYLSCCFVKTVISGILDWPELQEKESNSRPPKNDKQHRKLPTTENLSASIAENCYYPSNTSLGIQKDGSENATL